jgi:hypothetical protein
MADVFSGGNSVESGQRWRGVLLAACILAAAVGITAFTSAPAPVIRVVASDYAYIDVPPVVRHGLTYFAFKNVGKVRHEMSLLRLEPGVSVTDVIKNEKAGGKGRAKFFKTVGLLIEPPGGSTIGWLAMGLRSGETYVLICSLRDKPDAPQHFDLGMYSAFIVR